ncbi:MAG: glycine cleavage system protein GcvH [Deltaproteobacteria bacterium]|nr:MAG: glycine cleavage system protein GcvH [Deltaproteobacteria bacterium]
MKVGDYDLPDELYYHEEHSWAKVEDGKVKVGMNDMFQSSAGDIVYVDLPFEGDEVTQGEVCGKIQSRKWIGKLVAPVSGEIAEVNSELESDTTLINKEPYGGGWIVVIEPSNLDEDLGKLMKGDAVVSWMEAEIKRAKEMEAQAEKKE